MSIHCENKLIFSQNYSNKIRTKKLEWHFQTPIVVFWSPLTCSTVRGTNFARSSELSSEGNLCCAVTMQWRPQSYAQGLLCKFLKCVSNFLFVNLWKTEIIFAIYGHFPICYTNLCFFGYSCPRLACTRFIYYPRGHS